MPPISVELLAGVTRRDLNADVNRFQSLTKRELEVACLMIMGWANYRIAERLHISPKTLDIHRNNIKRKMKCDNDRDTTVALVCARLVIAAQQNEKE